MIKKLIEVQNVGKFENYKSSELSFGKFNGIYSDNGQGKSTLTTILRSFSDNNGKVLIGRRTVGVAGEVSCKIETDKGFRVFKNENWDQSDCKILVFDAHFVNQNIYSGMHVGIDHRRKLYQFIIGESAIHLNEQVNLIADQISALNSQLSAKKADLNKVVGHDTDVDAFVRLPKIDNVEDVIAAKGKEVNALTDRDAVLKRRLFGKIVLPSLTPEFLKPLLDRTFEDISKDSEQKVRARVKGKLDGNGENWIKQGVIYQAQSKDCPFCGSDTESNDLIAAYGDYFNESYIAFKNKIETHRANFGQQYNEALIERVKKAVSDNLVELEFWTKYVSVNLQIEDKPIISEQKITEFFGWFNSVFGNLLEDKSRAPLDRIECDFAAIELRFLEFRKKVDLYNEMVDRQNSVVQHYRSNLGSSDIETERKSLRNLKLSRARHIDEFRPLAEQYMELSSARDSLVAQKKIAQQKLDDETNRIPKDFQKSINYYLERFGAEFRIIDKKKVNPSGQAATEYKLSIKGVEINLGDNKTPEEVTSFQNTLSEGDKSTLAFSYFLARLESEPSLSEKILVFDDPISSLDRFRRGWTRNILRAFGEKSKQLIVLSHDPAFLEEMAYNLRGKDFKCFEILWDSERGSSYLATTTSENLNKNDHLRNIEKVRNYLKSRSGNLEDVKARLRHLCEYYLRGKYPKSFKKKDNLGRMIDIVRDADSADVLFGEKTRLTEFEVINDYSIEENHAQDGSQGRIDAAELLANCKTTFTLIEEPIPE